MSTGLTALEFNEKRPYLNRPDSATKGVRLNL
jgi:hypothetical protein